MIEHIDIKRLNVKDLLPKNDKISHDLSNVYIDVNAKYKGNTENID